MMTEQHEAKSTMIRYLLGQMSDAERSSFEERYQKDSDLFFELAELENDLIDLYALGTLSKSEQEQMRLFIGDPDRQKRLKLAETLGRYPNAGLERVLPTAPKARTSLSSMQLAVRAIAAVAAAALIVGISLLVVTNRNLRRDVEALRNQQSSAAKREQALEQQINTLTRELEEGGTSGKGTDQPPFLAQNTVTFNLRSDIVRGDGPASTFAIPSSAALVVFNVTVPGHAPSNYGLFLETADGDSVWRQERVKGTSPDGLNTQLAIKLQSRILTDGDYVLRVTTGAGQKIEDVAGYSFRVVHR